MQGFKIKERVGDGVLWHRFSIRYDKAEADGYVYVFPIKKI